jgi:hypothetical protein
MYRTIHAGTVAMVANVFKLSTQTSDDAAQ